jgi:hypothetical protein
MIKPILGLAILLATLATATLAAAKPRTIALREPSLAAAKAELARGDSRLATPLAQLRAEADELLKRKPASVLDKTLVAASGDRHDYFSFAPYWWPDPKKPDGQPYLRRDGDRNPDSRKSCFNLEAFLLLARLGEQVGIDLWSDSTADGRSLDAALRFLAPYVDPALTWPRKDLDATNRTRLLPLLQEGVHHSGDPRLRALLEKFGRRPAPGEFWRFNGPARP